jgi:hypothetical protein
VASMRASEMSRARRDFEFMGSSFLFTDGFGESG